MNLKNFNLMLDENKKTTHKKRIDEMRSLNKSSEEMTLEFAKKLFTEDSRGKLEAQKFLIGNNPYLKNFLNMDEKNLENQPKREMEKLRNRYSKYMSMKEFNSLVKQSNSKIVEKLVERVIENG
ncbi:MAG: hypothetical protein ACOCQD_02915 [archaeon]